MIRHRLFRFSAASSSIRSALRLLWSEADWVSKRLVLVTLLLVTAASIVSGLAPLVLKIIVDTLGDVHSPGTSGWLLALVVAYALSQWLARSLVELRGMYHGRTDQRVQRQLSFKLFKHVMSLPLRFHMDRKTGALSQTLTNGLIGYRMMLHHLMLTVLPVVVELGTMAAVLVLLEHTTFLAIISVSVLAYTLAFWNGVVRIRSPARAASNAHIDATAVLTDSIINYETVKYFGAESRVRSRYTEALAETEGQWASLYKRKMENGLVIAGIFALSLGVSVYVAVNKVQQGTMSVGEFVLVNAYILQITRPLEMLGFAFRGIAEGMAFIDKMADLLRQKLEPMVVNSRKHLPNLAPELVFDRVSYAYTRSRTVLNDVSFVVPSGKTIGVVGASGSGKSSLVRLLVRFVEPTKGTIFLNGIPLTSIPVSELRNAIAVVPQDIALFNDSIAYNISFGAQTSSEADIVNAAKIAHVHDFIVGLPDGYETKVGERGLKLSGGEKQRIAIARAAIKKPNVFVFDEATSSLDSQAERAILNDLMRIAKSTTTLIIAHRLSTVVNVDEIVVLCRGKLVERGTHDKLLEQRGAYAAMWQAQHTQDREYEDALRTTC